MPNTKNLNENTNIDIAKLKSNKNKQRKILISSAGIVLVGGASVFISASCHLSLHEVIACSLIATTGSTSSLISAYNYFISKSQKIKFKKNLGFVKDSPTTVNYPDIYLENHLNNESNNHPLISETSTIEDNEKNAERNGDDYFI